MSTHRRPASYSIPRMLLVAASSFSAFAASAATLQILETTKTQATTCTPPPQATSFSTTDSSIWAYFSISGLKTTDQVFLTWNRPGNGGYQSGTWQGLAGTQCFVVSLTNAQFAPYPGTWFLAVSIGGIYQSLRPTFTVTGAPPCTVTSMAAGINNGQANIVLTQYGESSVLQLTVAPPQATPVALSTSFGSVQSLTTPTNGIASPLYSSGPTSAIGNGQPFNAQTVAATINGAACGKTFSNLATVYNYDSFNIHQSAVSNSTFTNSSAVSASWIQSFFASKNSFLAQFYFVNSTGGFIDINNNGGKYETNDPLYLAKSGNKIAVGTVGASAASYFLTQAQKYGINPKLLLTKAQVEESLISVKYPTMPSATVLNSAFGCGAATDFYDQTSCAASTFAMHFADTSWNGRSLHYPFWFISTDGIHHCPNSCVAAAFVVNNAATYSQYRYTPYVQASATSGGVFLLEQLWQQYGF